MTDELFDAREELTGEVLGVYHADRSTGFGVVEVAPGDGEREPTGARCAGPLAELVEGQSVRLVGRWTNHPRFGRTFDALFYELLVPTTVAGIDALRRSPAFADVPDGALTRAVAEFGADVAAVIEHEPDRLTTQAGLDVGDADRLRRAWLAGRALGDLLRLVAPAGWPVEVARAAHTRFGADVVALAKRDPYALVAAERVRFAHADRLGRHLGIDADDPRRLAGGALAAVAGARWRDGHEHLPRTVAVAEASRLLKVEAILATEGVDAAVASGTLERDEVDGGEVVATPVALAAERGLAAALARLVVRPERRLVSAIRALERGAELTDDQVAAVEAVLARPVSVLTGGPGTGKTRTVQEVVAAATAAGLNVALCAPTGRAAKRLEELAGAAATTIHRLLEARPDGDGGYRFRHGEDEPLPHDLVIVDEVSMCDTWLAGRLVAAVDDHAHLLLVGDADQLPSVGPGDVLRDVIRSGVVGVTRLTQVHRQAQDSRIVALARQVLAGGVDPLPADGGDVFLAAEPDHDRIVERVVRAVAERVPERFDVDVDDVQVLAPVYRGPVGVDALNAALKRALNPGDGQPVIAGHQVGDRVMQTRNDAELDVANGDVGRVVDVSAREGTVRVRFARGDVSYDRARARDLVAAWAVTVHKSQGGEWPVVVLVCDRSHRGMLWRGLLYTAVTRAQRALIVVGQQAAFDDGVRHDRPSQRRTGLAWRLRTLVGST